MRNLGGAIGIAVSATMLNDRLNFHYLRLNEHVSAGQPQIASLLDRQAAYWTSVAGNTLDTAQAGLANLHHLIYREALTLTYADAYYALSLCFVVALIAVVFSKPISLNAPPPDAH